MGWLFKKKRDVIDLTEHQKRRIVNQADRIKNEASGYKDFSGNHNADLFSAISSSTPEQNKSSNIKLDDIEFKVDNLRKKIDDILNRLEVVEKKAGIYGA